VCRYAVFVFRLYVARVSENGYRWQHKMKMTDASGISKLSMKQIVTKCDFARTKLRDILKVKSEAKDQYAV
jgi:hypothetical protein